MIQSIINTINQNEYNITVIDHVAKTMSKLSLDEAINKFNCQLNKFDSVVMTEATHDTLSSYKQFKPAKSTVVVTKQASALSSNRSINYSDYSSLSCKFANPDICADLFIDKIELTFPLTKKEAKKLLNELFVSESNRSRIKYKKHSNGKSVKYQCSFTIEAKRFASLMALLLPVSRNINRVKLSYNPSNHEENDMRVFAIKLRKVCGNKYLKRINNTNITRFDVTFDSDGYFVENVIFNLDKSSYFKLFISPDGKQETRLIGANRSTRAQAYDKSAEQINNGVSDIDMKSVNTRFEVSFRPHNIKVIKGLKIKELNKIHPFFSSITVYDSAKLKQALGENTADWSIVQYFGVAALKRTKNNTQRIRLSRLLNSCTLDVNDTSFNVLIQKRLTEVCNKLKEHNIRRAHPC